MNKIVFKKAYERETTLVMQALYSKAMTGNNYLHIGSDSPYRPALMHYVSGDNVEIWENEQAMHWFFDQLYAENQKGTAFISAVLADQREVLAKIKPLREKVLLTAEEVREYLQLIERGVANVALYFSSGMDERTPQAVKDLAVEIRTEDDFFANNDRYIRSCLKVKGCPEHLTDVVLLEEFEIFPSVEVLEKRAQGALLVDGRELVLTNLFDYVTAHPEFEFKGLVSSHQEATEVRGQIAQKGKVAGKVRIVKNRAQANLVEEGEVIVSPMTTPDFIVGMHKAAAFVTDEGGIVCHAAIVAREMKKPCVIGTKIASQVFKDGDVVEVDADVGVVKLTERT